MPMPYCKACGYELTSPQEELHDPEALSDVAQSVAPDGLENPDTAHLNVRDGKKGWRYYCAENGQTTSIVEQPPQPESPEGEGQPSPDTQGGSPNPKGQEVYDMPEEKSQEDILKEVVTNPIFELNEAQIKEIQDWASDYDGRLPPDSLEKIMSNFTGIAAQTAKLAREKYETKLNKWIRDQSQDDGGPPLGLSPPRPNPNGPNRKPPTPGRNKRQENRPPRGGQQQGGRGGGNQREEGREGGRDSDGPLGRERRVRRRQNAADIIAEEAASEIADAFAKEFAEQFGFGLKIARTVLERKAETDPDWFIEKTEQWDMDVMEAFMEASEEKKKREEQANQRSQVSVDQEADDALERVLGDDKQTESTSTESNKPPEHKREHTPDQTASQGMTESPPHPEEEETIEQEPDDEFDEVFGDSNIAE